MIIFDGIGRGRRPWRSLFEVRGVWSKEAAGCLLTSSTINDRTVNMASMNDNEVMSDESKTTQYRSSKTNKSKAGGLFRDK